MSWDPRTIDEQILCLARLTGASDAFVVEVRALFVRRGIALNSDSAPYLSALEDAFLREERTRARAVPLAPHEVEMTRPTGRAVAIVVRPEREIFPLVPGPEELQ